jgi:hypothetical protein
MPYSASGAGTIAVRGKKTTAAACEKAANTSEDRFQVSSPIGTAQANVVMRPNM